jgi:hypothetical protein
VPFKPQTSLNDDVTKDYFTKLPDCVDFMISTIDNKMFQYFILDEVRRENYDLLCGKKGMSKQKAEDHHTMKEKCLAQSSNRKGKRLIAKKLT